MRRRCSGIGKIHIDIDPPAAPECLETAAAYTTSSIAALIDFVYATGEHMSLITGTSGTSIGTQANMFIAASNNMLRRFEIKIIEATTYEKKKKVDGQAVIPPLKECRHIFH